MATSQGDMRYDLEGFQVVFRLASLDPQDGCQSHVCQMQV